MDYIFFDFNGTLIDDLDLCLNLLNEMLLLRNHKPVSKEHYLEIFTFPVIDYYKKAGFVFPEDNFEELANIFIKSYKEKSKECKLFDDVIFTLETLKKAGKHLFILSASEKTMLIKQLKMYGIYDYFDAVLGKDNIYAEGKSEIGISFMKKHNFNKDKCVFIGDTLHDEETAKEMGIKCYLVTRGHQSKNVLKQGVSTIYSSLKEIKF